MSYDAHMRDDDLSQGGEMNRCAWRGLSEGLKGGCKCVGRMCEHAQRAVNHSSASDYVSE